MGISETLEQHSSKVIKMTPIKCFEVAAKRNVKKSWTQFSAAWKTERQREQEEMERRKKRRAIVRKGSHSGELLNVPPGKGTIDSLCPI